MGLALVHSRARAGVHAPAVRVEVHLSGGLPRMTIVGLPYSHAGQSSIDEIVGGAPYGATTIAGGDGSRLPSAIDLEGARHQGELVARTAAKLFG